MRKLACFCGSENDSIVNVNGKDMILCQHCQTVRIPEVPENYGSFYESAYYHTRYQVMTGQKPFSNQKRMEHDLEVAKARISQITSSQEGIFNDKKVLDVGCGSGGFVLALSQMGVDVQGLEATAECLWDEIRDEVILGGVEGLSVPYRSIDMITMFDVLEHLEEPLMVLKKIHNILKRQEGILIIEGPEFGHGEFSVTDQNKHHIKPDEHLWYFSIRGYKELLEMAGFNITLVEYPIPGRIRLTLKDSMKTIQLKIGLPAGIGDAHWSMLKMGAIKKQNDPCEITFCINEHGPNRVSPFLEMVPYSVENRYQMWQPNPHMDKSINWNSRGVDFGVILNYQLEQGERVEEILPEYETDFDYPVLFPPDVSQDAENLHRDVDPLVVLTMLSKPTNQLWGDKDWNLQKWVEVINGLYWLTKQRVVIIGSSLAEYRDEARDDIGLSVLRAVDKDIQHKVMDLVGQTDVQEVLAIIKEADLVVGLCSGLTIMSAHFRKPTVTLWPALGISQSKEVFQPGFKDCWVEPEYLASGLWRSFHFGAAEPIDIIEASAELLLSTDRDSVIARIKNGH